MMIDSESRVGIRMLQNRTILYGKKRKRHSYLNYY